MDSSAWQKKRIILLIYEEFARHEDKNRLKDECVLIQMFFSLLSLSRLEFKLGLKRYGFHFFQEEFTMVVFSGVSMDKFDCDQTIKHTSTENSMSASCFPCLDPKPPI